MGVFNFHYCCRKFASVCHIYVCVFLLMQSESVNSQYLIVDSLLHRMMANCSHFCVDSCRSHVRQQLVNHQHDETAARLWVLGWCFMWPICSHPSLLWCSFNGAVMLSIHLSEENLVTHSRFLKFMVPE